TRTITLITITPPARRRTPEAFCCRVQFSYHLHRTANHGLQTRCGWTHGDGDHRECPLVKGRVQKRTAPKNKTPSPCLTTKRPRSAFLFSHSAGQIWFVRNVLNFRFRIE